jgi:hypothetical protein
MFYSFRPLSSAIERSAVPFSEASADETLKPCEIFPVICMGTGKGKSEVVKDRLRLYEIGETGLAFAKPGLGYLH